VWKLASRGRGNLQKKEFEKDLVVWKQKYAELQRTYGFRFEKDLVVWKLLSV